MVHRSADSRLLVNLLTHEKDYSKQLANLLDHSQASLTSFSAYASASAPPTSQIIVSVAGALYGADEALRKYAAAVDQWQQQLKTLKEMEDGLGNIIRDREILVTRLIKASKNSKPPRDTSIPNSSSSTLSFNGFKPEVQVGSKLSAAQTELQACEAHLANKEKELDAFRTAAIRSGLQVRCKALSECGWTWAEMGKEGLRALDMFEMPNGNAHPSALPPLPTHKPLPDLTQDHPSSDHSSLAPSQSASQIAHFDTSRVTSPLPKSNSTQYTLTIGPAHSISEHTMPNGRAHRSPRVVEEPGGSSAEEGDQHQKVEVIENERFLPSRKRKGPVLAHVRTVSEAPSNRRVHFPSSTSDTFLLRSPTEREFDKGKRGGSMRRGSHGVFGSIAALFRGHKGGSVDGDSPTTANGVAKWKTRTDKNLKKGGGGDSSDEEDLRLRQRLGTLGPSVSAPHMQDTPMAGPDAGTSRMRKRLKRGSVQVPAASAPKETVDERGWMSEGDTETIRGRKGKMASAINLNESNAYSSTQPSAPGPSHDAAAQNGPGVLSRGQSLKKTRPRMPNGGLQLVSGTPAEVSLSRNSSISRQSVVSAPAVTRHVSMSAADINISPSTPMTRRRNSIEHSPKIPSPSKPGPSANVSSGKVISGVGYPSTRSTGPSSTKLTKTKRTPESGMNLMSIVEDVRKNRDMFVKQQDPNRLLVLPKAPPPVSELLEWEEQREREAKQEEENLRSIAAAADAILPTKLPTPATPSTPVPTHREERPSKPVPIVHSPPVRIQTPKPLRSALRNVSRSPSPQNPPLPPLAGPSKHRNGTSPPPAPSSASKNHVGVHDDDDDDTASISSYETGLEVLNEEGESRAASPVAPVPPPHDSHNTKAINSDLSQSTDSTTTDVNGAPRRTKSVRMSLPPTFSTTPPAIYEDYDGGGAAKAGRAEQHEPWSSAAKRRSRPVQDHDVTTPRNSGHIKTNGWSSRIDENPTHKDVWEDSSDEDEEYGMARRLLGRLSRKA